MPFAPEGVAGVVDFGSRLAEGPGKALHEIQRHLQPPAEANYWRPAQARRSSRASMFAGASREDLAEQPDRGADAGPRQGRDPDRRDLGGRGGQVNGLAVYDMGDYSFGNASRITATVYAGRAVC